MSPQQEREVNERARAFIDKIVSINKAHGMGLAEDTYEEAVKGSAETATATMISNLA